MEHNVSTNPLHAKCVTLQKELEATKEDRNRWHKQATELRRQVKALEKLQQDVVASLRTQASEHVKRIAAIEHSMLEMKKRTMQREFRPCRRVTRASR